MKTPKLVKKTSEDIYKQAIERAKSLCPDWSASENKTEDDPGLVLLKIFARLSGLLVERLNEIPGKHSLAFFDFMGVDLLPPQPSKTPLTFSLAKNVQEATVPARTKVAVTDRPDEVFETLETLPVYPFKLSSVFSCNPTEDIYADLKDFLKDGCAGHSIFSGSSEPWQKHDHVLILEDHRLFDVKRKGTVTLNFSGSNLHPEYFAEWDKGAVGRVTSPPARKNRLTIPLTISEAGIPDSRLQTSNGLPLLDDEGNPLPFPTLTGITVDLNVPGILPEATFAGDAPIDAKKGFHPFGETPVTGGIFYLACDEAIGKKGASVTVDFSVGLKDASKNAAAILAETDAILKWEQWDGAQWTDITITRHQGEALHLKGDGSISFVSDGLQLLEINGKEKFWIRARIISGGYGTPGDYMVSTPVSALINDETIAKELTDKGYAFAYNYVEPQYTPPFITRMSLTYVFASQPLEGVISLNSFEKETETPTPDAPFQPFKLSQDTKQALYLGFKGQIGQRYHSIFFSVTAPLYGEPKPKRNAELSWEYQSGATWKPLTVTDETESFTRNGLVTFTIPESTAASLRFEENAYWIRVSLNEAVTVYPILTGIHPNTVWASNDTIRSDEALGSGNGKAGLTLPFSLKPVLPGEVIRVREPSLPSEEERKEINDDSFEIQRNEKGETQEVWITWKEVKDFALSNSMSRHYVIDRSKGTLTFGDGKKGMVPPKGSNNIVAQGYQSGGGSKGDVLPGSVTSLKSAIPGIESVTNPVSASGGRNSEEVPDAIRRAPRTIKSRDRAVTLEDFEWLALESTQEVAKSRCLQGERNNAHLVIVPNGTEDTPIPTEELIETVLDYLRARCLVTIRDNVEIHGPLYVPVNVTMKVKPLSPNESALVRERVKERTREFLHPLRGGQNQKSWEFGESVYISELASIIEGTEGVDYVESIKLRYEDETGSPLEVELPLEKMVPIGPNALPCAGEITIMTT